MSSPQTASSAATDVEDLDDVLDGQDDGQDPDDSADEGPEDGQDDADPADDQQQQRQPSPANAEAARYRTQLRAAEAERDVLADRVERYIQADAERAVADVLAEPSDLWLFASVLDVVDDDGELDPDRARELAAEVARNRPLLAVPPPDLGQGRRGTAPVTPHGWAGVLRNTQGTSRPGTR